MPDTHDLRWLAVRITLENREELQALTKSDIDDDPYMSYGLYNNSFIPSKSIILGTEELIPDFSKIPEARFMIDIGIPTREVFNLVWGEPE